jgi:hypothetical protein
MKNTYLPQPLDPHLSISTLQSLSLSFPKKAFFFFLLKSRLRTTAISSAISSHINSTALLLFFFFFSLVFLLAVSTHHGQRQKPPAWSGPPASRIREQIHLGEICCSRCSRSLDWSSISEMVASDVLSFMNHDSFAIQSMDRGIRHRLGS